MEKKGARHEQNRTLHTSPSLLLIVIHMACVRFAADFQGSYHHCTSYAHIVNIDSLLRIPLVERSKLDNNMLYSISSLLTTDILWVVDTAPISNILTTSPDHQIRVLSHLLLCILSPHPPRKPRPPCPWSPVQSSPCRTFKRALIKCGSQWWGLSPSVDPTNTASLMHQRLARSS